MEPDSGYYPATYGFENDEINTSPERWISFTGTGNPQNYLKVIVEGIPEDLGKSGVLVEVEIKAAENPCHGLFVSAL